MHVQPSPKIRQVKNSYSPDFVFVRSDLMWNRPADRKLMLQLEDTTEERQQKKKEKRKQSFQHCFLLSVSVTVAWFPSRCLIRDPELSFSL